MDNVDNLVEKKCGLYVLKRGVVDKLWEEKEVHLGDKKGQFSIHPMGDRAVRLSFGREISPQLHRRVRQWCRLLQSNPLVGIEEWVPTYGSVTIYYNPYEVNYTMLVEQLYQLHADKHEERFSPRRLKIPVCYEKELGVDLVDVACIHHVSEEEVIREHSRPDYLIYMIGFTPGFPYLGGMSSRIATPRLATPRPYVESGSVGIAGTQTGVYPISSPGGWRIIGRTPIPLLDWNDPELVPYRAGDYLRFIPISRAVYHQIEQEVKAGEYRISSTSKGEKND
ncbi:5-oxoprolinase subunit PxpB [Mechercharimyces sp. CAU 1602]|uniref:5-oxoprolinase subunit PxpB n=1 Tax=Mechercharimyces sp. CAU 1602 TaxID=2973933 RepID=UPI002161FC32|nr:5-oxoprolinase subunit PxpB [Mechercharimyces sp. CAU 1602]